MKKILLLLIFASFIGYSQSKEYLPQPKYPSLFRTIPVLNGTEPEWVKGLYSENPNWFLIEKQHDEFYNQKEVQDRLILLTSDESEEQEYEGDIHHKNFVNVKIALQNQLEYRLEEDGTIIQVSENELIEKRNQRESGYKNNMQNRSAQSVNAADWQPVGPMEVYGTNWNNNVARKESSQSNIYCVAVSPSNENTIYVGAENSVVFKSTNKGETWISVTEGYAISSIKSIAIHPTNENIVYFGTNTSLYKTSNGGTTWNALFTITNSNIEKISIDPTNGDNILIATEQGLKRSTDGGLNFVLVFTDKVWDIERNTANSNIIYAGKTNSVLNRSEIWKSTDNGLTFVAITTGWFTPTNASALSNGGIRLATTPADANRVYAVVLGNDLDSTVDKGFIGVYRSDNGGDTWYLPFDANNDGTPNNDVGGPYTNATSNWCVVCYGPYEGTAYTAHQGFYDLAIEVSNTNADLLFVGGSGMSKSSNGGRTYQGYSDFYCPGCTHHQHLDIQGIQATPTGVWVASDGGMNWYDANFNPVGAKNDGLNATSFWHFGQGWNKDVMVSGSYHNGDLVYHEGFPQGKFRNIGGVESGTGYVETFDNSKVHHSDTNSRKLSSDINENFPVIGKYSVFPNQDYIISNKSDVYYDSTYSNILYIGKENKIMKSLDNGQNFTTLYTFGATATDLITDIALTSDDSKYIYAVQKTSGNCKLWKSIDGGISWVQLTLPNTATIYTTLRLQVAQDDKNEIYFSRSLSNTSVKLWKSLNGGITWNQISTAVLNGHSIKNIAMQDGTDGGIYAVGDNKVFYKNNTLADWQDYSVGIPSSYSHMKIVPFYRDGKLRSSGSRGFWETPLFEDSRPIARPITIRDTYYCSQDTIRFEDYSILKHQGATWQWQFPGASYVSSTSVRNPKVLYPSVGNYDVILTVTDANGFSSTKTVYNMVRILNTTCNSLSQNSSKAFNSISGTVVKNETLNQNGVNTYTISCWVKPRTQDYNYKPFTSIQFSDNRFAKLEMTTSNEVRFTPDTSTWSSGFGSGLFVNLNEWNYVAVVVTSTHFTLYVNDKKYVRNMAIPLKNFRKFFVGQEPDMYWWMYYLGEIDEIKFWKRSLTEEEIRLNRHLIKSDAATDVDMISYYQFDDISIDNTTIFDKKNNFNLISSGSGGLVDSTAPVGMGVSQKQTINASGTYNYLTPGVSLTFGAGTLPNGDVYITKLNNAPFGKPTTNYINENNYWIVNNYGTNSTFNGLSSMRFSGLFANPTSPNELRIFNRTDNAFNSVLWADKDGATQYSTSTTIADFLGTNITSFGQFYFGSTVVPAIPCGMFSTTWNGTSWSNGKPTNSLAAIFNGNFTSFEDINACSVNVNGTSQVTIRSNNNLLVDGIVNIAPTANLTIENNANLVQIQDVNNSGNVTVKRNSNALMRLDYTIWSSPVTGTQTLKQFSPLTLNNRFYNYNTTTNLYNAVPNPVTQLFEEGKGYLIRMPDNHPTTPTLWNGQFIGTPNNGNTTLNLNYIGVGQGFNMIGNPYPSTIDANVFIAQNAATISGTIYYWRKVNNADGTAYATYTLAGSTKTPSSPLPTNIIQAGQGFLVEAKNVVNPTVTFTNAMRLTNNSNSFFRNLEEVENNRFWLNLSGSSGVYNQLLVNYMTGATLGIDEAIDGKNINDNSISLTSLIENNEYTIQGRALPFENTDVIPLNFKTNTAGNYTISIDNADGLFAEGQEILIRDNQEMTIHSLNDSDYSFTSVAGNFNSRFEIVYQNETLGNDAYTFDTVVVYPNPISNGEVLNIKGNNEPLNVTVFDLAGKQIAFFENVTNSIETNIFTSGIYLIRLETPTKTINKKLIVN